MTIRITALSLGILVAFAAGTQAAPLNNPSATLFPTTDKLRSELGDMNKDLTSLAKRLDESKDAVENARKMDEAASALVKGMDKTDDDLVRIIRQLKPISGIPQLRLLKAVVANLESLQKDVHDVRVKADKAEKEVFKPLSAKLKEAESDLKLTIAECKGAASRANLTRGALGLSETVIQGQGSPAGAVAALENLSKGVRTGIAPAYAGVKSLDNASDDAEKAVEHLETALKGLTALQPAVAKVTKDLIPIDSSAREMDKVLSKKLELKLFGKKFGFSVRQVLEGPGKVADFVLKPFDELANKALAPVLKKFKLQLSLPKEFAKIPTELSSATARATSVNTPLKDLEKTLDSKFITNFEHDLDKVPNNKK